ncbi:MAG: hypothetical protein ACK5LV_09225 [Lachnospirales bacterium]
MLGDVIQLSSCDIKSYDLEGYKVTYLVSREQMSVKSGDNATVIE